MEKSLHRRNSVLLFLVMLSMVLMAACDSTPATPVPAPTATTGQVVAPTATTAQSSNPAAPTATTAARSNTTPATGGSLGSAKAGNIVPITRSAPKGELSTRTLGNAKSGANLSALEARNTATPVAQATPTEEVSNQTSNFPEDWSVVLLSDFSDGDTGSWLTGSDGNISAQLEDDAFVMTAADGSGFYNWAEETNNWDDGYISATLKLDGVGVVGLTARLGKENNKFHGITCVISTTQNYGCYKEIDGVDERVANGRSSAIKKTGTNELALLGMGDDFTFFINGTQVRTFSGEGVTEGAWGTYLESPQGETTSAAFSRILFMGPGGDITEPTPEPEEATATPEEEEATPTATAATVDEDVIVSTDFSEDGGSWLTGEGDSFSVAVTDGELAVGATTPSSVVATAPEEAMDVAEARIEATLRIEDSSADAPGWVGVSARSQEFASNYEDWGQVFCGINNGGDYSCNRLTTANDGIIEFKELLHGTTDSIVDGDSNTIALSSKGNRWTFEINGEKVGSFTDNSQKSGAWGVLVMSGDDATTGYFSKISIYNR